MVYELLLLLLLLLLIIFYFCGWACMRVLGILSLAVVKKTTSKKMSVKGTCASVHTAVPTFAVKLHSMNI
jgi:hypothetical protein